MRKRAEYPANVIRGLSAIADDMPVFDRTVMTTLISDGLVLEGDRVWSADGTLPLGDRLTAKGQAALWGELFNTDIAAFARAKQNGTE